MSNTQDSVSPMYITKHSKVGEKYSAVCCIFNSLLSVWKCCETLSFVVDVLHKIYPKYSLLTEFEGCTVSYGPSFFLLDLWPKREVRRP